MVVYGQVNSSLSLQTVHFNYMGSAAKMFWIDSVGSILHISLNVHPSPDPERYNLIYTPDRGFIMYGYPDGSSLSFAFDANGKHFVRINVPSFYFYYNSLLDGACFNSSSPIEITEAQYNDIPKQTFPVDITK